MYCSNCGVAIQAGMRFCNACGKPVELAAQAGPIPAPAVAAPRPAPSSALSPSKARGRLEKHLKLLGILWILISLMRLVPGILLFFFKSLFSGFMPGPARWFFLPIAGFIGALLMATSLAGVAAGIGLLERRTWARVLAIVLGIIYIIHFPFGTALGVYTLWVLMPNECEQEYRRMAQA